MSVIQSIRDKGAWIIFAIIALALIAFILQDASFQRGNIFSNTTTLGKVNGRNIERADFEEKLAMQQQMYGAQAQRDQLIGMLWNQEIDNALLQDEYNKLGIQVTSNELTDILFGDNSPFKNEFTDPKTGEFKVDDAKRALAQIKKSKNAEQLKMINDLYIKPAIEQTLRYKYQSLVQQGMYVPKWMVEKTIADNNAIANVSYIYAPYASVSDSSVKVSDQDIQAYISKHATEFKREEEGRNISYITFDAFPSAQDTANVLNQVQSVQAEFSTTADIKAFMSRTESEQPYLDAFVMKDKIQVPNAELIKALPVGGTYGPYMDGGNIVLARMIAKRTMPDSIKCRHVLVKIGTAAEPGLSDSAARKRIDSVAALAKNGVDFNELVQKYSDDQGSKGTKGEYEFASLQFPTLSKEFAEAVFYGATGDKKIVRVENDQYTGYHYVEVLNQRKVGEAVKVAYLSKKIVASNETIAAASTAAAQFASTSKNRKAFEDNAKKLNKFPLLASDVKENDFSIMGLGETRSLVRWIYENKEGDVSEPTEVADRYVVATITAIHKPGTLTVAEARPQVEAFVRNEKKAQQMITKFTGSTLEAMATASGNVVMRADSLTFGNSFIPNVGNEAKVVGAAFNKSLQGKVSTPIAGVGGVYALRVESMGAKANLATDAETVKQGLIQAMRMAAFRSAEALRKGAVIKDYRFKFY